MLLLKIIIKSLLLFFLISNQSLAMPYPSILDRWICGDKNGVMSPYFLTAFTLDLLNNGEYREANEYILWYLSRLNYPDKFGYTGTIYDFFYKAGQIMTINDYDSADAYAGTFLALIYFYLIHTEDTELINKNLSKIKDVAYVIIKLIDPEDGLVRAKPNLQTKFLMDNIEAYTGLALFCKTLTLLNDGDSSYYCEHANLLGVNIKKSFKQEYRLCWAIDEGFCHEVKEDIAYPDGLAYIFWNVFMNVEVDLTHKILNCEQLYAVELIKIGIKHINMNKH